MTTMRSIKAKVEEYQLRQIRAFIKSGMNKNSNEANRVLISGYWIKKKF